MTKDAKRKLKYSRNENFNLLPYVEWDRFVTQTGAQAEWGFLKILKYKLVVQIVNLFLDILGKRKYIDNWMLTIITFVKNYWNDKYCSANTFNKEN